MVACHVICASTDEEAEDLALSSDLFSAMFARLGTATPLQSVPSAREAGLTPDIRDALRQAFPKFVGSPETVRRQIEPILEGVDELMILSMIYDQEARRESYRLVSEAFS